MSVKLWVEKTMSYRSGLASLLMGLAVAAAGVMTHLPAEAQTGIANTKHNLGNGSVPANRNKFTGTEEICVFCHTPHGADTAAAVPLWNRTLGKDSSGAAVTYNTYDQLGTSTRRGGVADVGSVSLACLSCHDGTQAMNSVLNAPGSGTAWSTTGTWSGNNVDTATGKLKADVITNIGPDLRNDHPVGIQYAGGGYKKGDTAAKPALVGGTAPEFVAAVKDANKDVWWVDTSVGTAGTREKTDMMLYTRASAKAAGATVEEPFVECASCHDPHSTQTTFLRISNAGSAVCLACHIK
jgi:predicted CXXCH cytochrome family protein